MATPAICNTGRHVREYLLKDAEDFVEGAAVMLTAGELEASDLATILGFALHDAGADPFPDRVLVGVAKPDSTFWMSGDRAPLITDEGKSYDLEQAADGVTQVDTAAAGTTVFVEKVDLTRNLFEVRITDMARQVSLPTEAGS